MTLVQTLRGETLAADLERAYIALAGAFLCHRRGGGAVVDGSNSVSLDQAVSATEGYVDLRPMRASCNLITTDEERPGEIFDNLSHMFVLLQAISILRETCSLVPQLCAPTQQSEHEGERIADLQGEGWTLEAYGGVAIKNNDKLALDLRTLSMWEAIASRTFLAFRETAYGPVRKMRTGDSWQITSSCSVKRGGPFSATASACLIGRLNGVVVLEIGTVRIDRSARRLPGRRMV
jgi:hypothetical protein